MNPDFPARLAARLRDNPSFLQEMDDSLLGQLLFHYHWNELNAEDAAEVAALLETDPRAKEIYQRLEAADRFAASPDGKAWLVSLPDRVLPPRTAASAHAQKSAGSSVVAQRALSLLLASLRNSISDIFASHASLVTASGREGMERTLKDGKTRIFLKSDSAGRLWLQVTSTASEFAGRSFQVDVEPTPALLSFSEVTPGVHDARVCVSDELAAALSSGAELKLTPVPPS